MIELHRFKPEIMEKRMKDAGKAVVASYIAREGHGFGSSENEQVRLQQTGAFVAQIT